MSSSTLNLFIYFLDYFILIQGLELFILVMSHVIDFLSATYRYLSERIKKKHLNQPKKEKNWTFVYLMDIEKDMLLWDQMIQKGEMHRRGDKMFHYLLRIVLNTYPLQVQLLYYLYQNKLLNRNYCNCIAYPGLF